jgi:hypothetical protein
MRYMPCELRDPQKTPIPFHQTYYFNKSGNNRPNLSIQFPRLAVIAHIKPVEQNNQKLHKPLNKHPLGVCQMWQKNGDILAKICYLRLMANLKRLFIL